MHLKKTDPGYSESVYVYGNRYNAALPPHNSSDGHLQILFEAFFRLINNRSSDYKRSANTIQSKIEGEGMKEDHFTYTADDGTSIFTHKWIVDDGSGPKAVVQIAHGMAEHSARYSDFASALVKAGYFVYANDHRGHGKTAGSLENVGYFADREGWRHVLSDMHGITQTIRTEYPEAPVFLFGHSMGSFLSRHYIFQYPKAVRGAILSGTGGDPGALGMVGAVIAAMEGKIRGKRARSRLMTALSFGSFNNAFKPNRTDFDWLSRNEKAVDAYIEDSYCGDVFTTGFFQDLLAGIREINKKENIQRIPKDFPIYLFAGDKDPVGANGKGVEQVADAYRQAGISDVSCKLYPEGRHEMLNEINRKEVYQDVITWLNGHC